MLDASQLSVSFSIGKYYGETNFRRFYSARFNVVMLSKSCLTIFLTFMIFGLRISENEVVVYMR